MITEKNWLIRTKSNHILGPVTKEKVLELLHNGSIKGDDEVCSGNGFWFFIREENMVDKYLHANEAQPFNPISEAKDVLTADHPVTVSEASQSDITLVEGLNLAMLKAEHEFKDDILPKVPVPKEELPNLPSAEASVLELPPKKNELKRPIKESPPLKKNPPLKKQGYLKYVGLFAFIVLMTMIYFRKNIIRYFLHGEMTKSDLTIISEVHAQDDLSFKKKSS